MTDAANKQRTPLSASRRGTRQTATYGLRVAEWRAVGPTMD